MVMFQICPKCSYARKLEDTGSTDVCPSCGIIFSKYIAATAARERALLEARLHKKPIESSSLLWPKWLLALLVLILASYLYRTTHPHINKQPTSNASPPALTDSRNSSDQREFADLFNSDTSFASLATRGQYTVIEVYLDQCTYCRELEAALTPFREKRSDMNLVRIHHPGSINNSIQASSREELEAKMRIMNERMSSYQLCASPHVEVYGPDKKPIAVDTCKNHDGTAYLWNWITNETGIARRSAPGLFTRML